MSDKDEEQIARERASVEAMKHAKGNMELVLARCATLQQALHKAHDDLGRCKDYIGKGAYAYQSSSSPNRTAHAHIDEMIAQAARALGA